jgi:hypothetical protein
MIMVLTFLDLSYSMLRLCIFLVTLLSLSSCLDEWFKCGGDYYLEDGKYLAFRILDKKSREIFPVVKELQVVDGDGKDVSSQAGWGNYWSFCFIDANKDRGVVDQRIERTFYLFLDTDQDTVNIDFEMRKDKCRHQVMKYIKVTYNDSVYFNDVIDNVPLIDFLK